MPRWYATRLVIVTTQLHLAPAIVSFANKILSTEQKKADFKPKEDAMMDVNASVACKRCCEFVESQRQGVMQTLDGANVENFLTALGLRFQQYANC